MKFNKRIVCLDGFSMSVQARATSYCTPRVDNATKYTHVEVGFPSEAEEMLMQWAEDREKPTDTVYGWVPAQTIALVCAKHGGIIEGNVPPGVPHLWATDS